MANYTVSLTTAFGIALIVFVSLLFRYYNYEYSENKRRLSVGSLPREEVDPSVHPIVVVIPTLNEGAVLPATISRLFSTCTLPDYPEPIVVVVDAGSADDDDDHALALLIAAHPTLQLRRYPCPPSRGGQLNSGAEEASSCAPNAPILLFLHADTLLPPGWDSAIFSALSSSRPPALGTFTLSLSLSPIPFSLRLMLLVANVRARYGGLPYGDQAYFLRRTTFDAVGGFPQAPIMEDVELLRRIRDQVKKKYRGQAVQVLDDPVVTSARRWLKKGAVWNTILNQLLILAWLCGVDSHTIYTWYYGRKPQQMARHKIN